MQKKIPATSVRRPPARYAKVPFSVDVALLRELGERLVGKPAVALGELVKNSYDADARSCSIEFGPDSIEIIDDGNGMTTSEFKRFWMRVGTTHKQQDSVSRRFERAVTGSKGVGRLAVQFLAEKIEIWTVSETDRSRALHILVDWTEAMKSESLVQAVASYRLEPLNDQLIGRAHGTRIRLTRLNQQWDEEKVRDLARELWFLQPPDALVDDIDDSFQVTVEGLNEADRRTFDEQMQAALSNWQAVISGSVVNGRRSKRCHIKVEFSDGEIFEETITLPNAALDKANFRVRIFNLAGRQKHLVSVADARKYFKKFGGVHVYDGGFRLPYYGVEQDWLKIEMDHSHRLTLSQLLPDEYQVFRGLQELPTLSRVFGIAKVSTAWEQQKAGPAALRSGEYLKIQVTRDRLVDNDAYQDLVHIVRWAMDYYATRARIRRDRDEEQTIVALDAPPVEYAIGKVRNVLLQHSKSVPRRVFDDLNKEISGLETSTAIKEKVVARERVLLAALATAGMAALGLEHEIGKELVNLRQHVDQLRELATNYDDPAIDQAISALDRWDNRVTATRRIFSPLMSEPDRNTYIKLKAAKVVANVAKDMKPLLRGTTVDVSRIAPDLRLPNGSLPAWHAIFQNVFTNAVNAMLDCADRRIRCRSSHEGGKTRIIVEDTGTGVNVQTADELFRPFVRRQKTTPEREALGLGGSGIGLTIVRMIASSLDCTVCFIEPAHPFTTAFALEWRDKKESNFD
jgi:signal transduction histidine kinase